MAYYEGARVDFCTVPPLVLAGKSPFARSVLAACRQIEFGRKLTYAELAESIGHPRAARAVGTALARNPIPLIIPCHRAVRSDGGLGGYRGGLMMKRALLEMEGVSLSVGDIVEADAYYY